MKKIILITILLTSLLLCGCQKQIVYIPLKVVPIPLAPLNLSDKNKVEYYEKIIKIHNNYNKDKKN